MWGAGSPLMLIWARSIGADLRAALISPPQHFTGEHLNIHVKTVTPQYSFHFFPSVFISKSNMGHENMCMHKEYKPYDCSSAGGQAGRGRVRTQSAEKEQEQKRLSCFILLKACLKQHFLSRDTVVLLKQSEVQKDRGGSVFVLFTFFSWPRIPKQRRAWRWSSTFWAFFFPPLFLLICLFLLTPNATEAHVAVLETLLKGVRIDRCSSVHVWNIRGSLSRFAFTWRQS